MKKIERPKVNKEAIAAQLKKKEEEEKKKGMWWYLITKCFIPAELEEQKRQAVLALRAEQEAAKNSKRRRDSSSVDLSHKKKANASEEQKKLDRRAKREDWYESQQLEERNSSSSEDDEEHFTQKSKGSKNEPDVKQKPKALSFKELMALAASNAKGEKPEEEMQAKKNGECGSKVKLKSHIIKGEIRDSGEKHKVSKAVTNKTSKAGDVERSVERVKSSHKINSSASKPSGSNQDRKSTLFPNTKSYSNGPTSSRKDLPSQSKPSPKLDKGSKSLVSDSKRTSSSFRSDEVRKHDGDKRKMSGGSQISHHQSKEKGGLSDPVKKTSVGANQVEKMSQKPHHPTKRNGSWLDPGGKAPPGVKQVGKASQKSHPPIKRNGGWLDPAEKPPAVAKQVENASQKSHHTPNKKGGWLDPVEKTPVTKHVGQASQKSHHPPNKKGGWLDPVEKTPVAKLVGQTSEKSHHPPKRKGGWLGPGEDTPVASQKSHHPPKRKGGWLDPVEDTPVASQKSHHPPKRKGGWLDPVEEPSVNSGHIDKTSKDNSKHVRESIEKKGLAAGRNGAKVSKGGHSDPVQSIPSKNKVVHSQSKEKKSLAAPSSSVSAKIKSPGQVKERKRGWLDPVGGEEPPLRDERGGGGWLGPVKTQNHLGPPPAKRTGGWLGPSVEPSFAAKRKFQIYVFFHVCGRLLSSEDEEEDSDMDGFIDDTPLEEEGADVSSYIKEIFGYDKSKYGYESDYALRSMEASYSQILKEEARSARIAMKEDAEEFRKEQEREKMKKLARAKKK
ncbi:Protein SPT2-like [Holothuria leucospilota]|uniref:Protein SPT2-like n=1 Tax=Holothuria leucospilota TaxID=206669 RepID=A0A9Q0YJG7_HOLLE|nr:Protein SPT2-like [Holothuria leucospilota]